MPNYHLELQPLIICLYRFSIDLFILNRNGAIDDFIQCGGYFDNAISENRHTDLVTEISIIAYNLQRNDEEYIDIKNTRPC